ncbi:phage tail protein I [Epibacterium ulvae]|uniref:phage tail protein I n=1 Tax=Epibacterium ulvae TaxID=1156985 RepID=UPI0024908D4A|nr:phage tail protein I [Epibacterium ulvae]
MARSWTDTQLDLVTPPQALDERGRAMIRVVDRMMAEIPIASLNIKDPTTCDASMLPALIAELSMEEFIQPNFPEPVVRRILQNHWALKKYKGFDAGVKLGLELLGMRAEITHWHQMNPMGSANTQRVSVTLGNRLFERNPAIERPRELDAARRMVEATQRKSQGVTLQFNIGIQGARRFAADAFGRVIDRSVPRVVENVDLKRRLNTSLIGRIQANTTNTVETRLRARSGVAIFGKLEAV